jgi:hypothetical protein
MSKLSAGAAGTTAALAFLVSGLWALGAGEALGQPVTERLLDRVEVTEQAGCSTVSVFFNFPVRYVSHFPLTNGRELCIRVRPLAIGTSESQFRFLRESLRPPINERAAVARLTYEGDSAGGPCIWLNFNHLVHFNVGQGEGYRSVDIAVSGPQPDSLCRLPAGAR